MIFHRFDGANYDGKVMEVWYRPTWLGRLVGFRYLYSVQYRGSGTVWHRLPSCWRCGTFTEWWLSCLWEKCQHESGE